MALFQIKNKVAIVTGASSGIGRTVVIKLALMGAKVALVAKNKTALEEVTLFIEKSGGTAYPFPFDLEHIENIPNLIQSVSNHFGDVVTVLINNAGTAVLGMVESVPMEAYQYNLNVNFFAPLALMKAVIPGMKMKRNGHILNVTSGVGFRGLPGVSPYCASKFALNALTESIRVELKPYGIIVSQFSPGLVDTSFIEKSKKYGILKETFESGKKTTPEAAASQLVSALIEGKRNVMSSFRTRIAFHFNYWFPSLLDMILLRKLKTKGQFKVDNSDKHSEI